MGNAQEGRRPHRPYERRFTASPIELRSTTDGMHFRGHAAVFDQETDLGYMREKVAPGAFSKTIKDGADVRFLFNHDPNTVMARTTGGSLRLTEDSTGLAVDADLDDSDPDVQRLLPKLKNGNVTQMSFGFSPVREKFEEKDRPVPLRVLKEVELFDVSPVTFPAYQGTDGGIALRAAAELGTPVAVSGFPLAANLPAATNLPAAAERWEVPSYHEFRRAVADVYALLSAITKRGSNYQYSPEIARIALASLSRLAPRDGHTYPPAMLTVAPESPSTAPVHGQWGTEEGPSLEMSVDELKRVLDRNRRMVES